MSALRKLLDGDLEHRSFIIRRQEGVQAQYTYAKKAAGVFADCLATMSAVKDAYAACIPPTKALERALKNALNLYDNHRDILATISSSMGMLATLAEIMALTEALLKQLDKSTPQVETHSHLAADEHAAHESAHIAASESILSCTDSLHAVDRSIAQKKGALIGPRHVPTEILPRIFIEAVEARQHEIITSLSSYYDPGPSHHDLDAHFKTLNLVPFTLSSTCKRWRAICQSTPRLWRYARMPMVISTGRGNKITGETQFERCVLLSQTQPIELTVYPCYDVTHYGAEYPDFVLPAESQILRVNIVWHGDYDIPLGVPSPTELCIVTSANSRAPYIQEIPTQVLANTGTLRCTDLVPWIDSDVGIKILRISLSKCSVRLLSETFLDFLDNCPQLEELHMENEAYPLLNNTIFPFEHEQLHTLSLKGIALPRVIGAFSAGCSLPRLSRLILTDINGLSPAWYSWRPCSTNDQFSRFTHIEVHAASEPSVVAHFRPLFEASTALRTLILVGSAVEPMLTMLMLSTPKGVQELRLSDSNASVRYSEVI
jgi:hypothetical protein